MTSITILDGGMGRELHKIGAPFRQPEWSALALTEAPHFVEKVHRSYIDAGADIITTNAYAVVPFHIGETKFTQQGKVLASLSGHLARKAVNGTDVKVAGCLPPLYGSYQPDAFNAQDYMRILTPLVQGQEPYVDFWLIETMSSYNEAQYMIKGVRSMSDKPIWVSFTLADNAPIPQLRSLEDVKLLKPLLHDVNGLLFNCSNPETMLPALQIIKDFAPSIPIGAYANNFDTTHKSDSANAELSGLRQDITPQKYLEFAKLWIANGASIIGGCCGIGPEHIQYLANHFKA